MFHCEAKMRFLLFGLFLISNSLTCYCEEIKDSLQHVDLVEYIGNPNNLTQIERPCPVFDLYCIKQFFAKHSKCVPQSGPTPDPLYRSKDTLYFSSSNATVIMTNVETTGLGNNRIEDFYINRKTDNLVLAVNIRNFTKASPFVYFQLFRVAKEPVVTADFASVSYTSVTFTAVIPNLENLDFERAEFSSFSDDNFPPITIGPAAFNTTDPEAQRSIQQLSTDLPTTVTEAQFTDAQYYTPIYIQYNICDFGLKTL